MGILRFISARVMSERLSLRLRTSCMSSWSCLSSVKCAQHVYASQILHLFSGKFVVIYFDDILVFSRTQEEHLFHLTQVLETLHKEK